MTSSPQTTPSDDTHRSDADENILAELSRILASPQFTRTSRSKRFLEYIVNETLCGRGDDLKGYTIAIDVFDKSINFDSSQNTVVRGSSLTSAQAAQTLLCGEDWPNRRPYFPAQGPI